MAMAGVPGMPMMAAMAAAAVTVLVPWMRPVGRALAGAVPSTAPPGQLLDLLVGLARDSGGMCKEEDGSETVKHPHRSREAS